MAHQVFAFEPPERFVAGTVGRGGGRLVSVVLEKVQVTLLAEKLEELLAEAHQRFALELPGPASDPPDNEPLDSPVDEEFRVGTLGLAFDVEDNSVIIEAIATDDLAEFEAETDAPEEDENESPAISDDLDRLRVRLTPVEVRAFIDRARRVISAGRPPCPLCGQPLDSSGHLCPRHNGYHRR
jgi:uncharacterized repeat protein (TIGR03847 family)